VSTVTRLRVERAVSFGLKDRIVCPGVLCCPASTVYCQHTVQCILPAHNSVYTTSTQFNVYCQHTVQCILPAHFNVYCQHTIPCILPAHNSVYTASTQFRVYCQHTIQCILRAHNSMYSHTVGTQCDGYRHINFTDQQMHKICTSCTSCTQCTKHDVYIPAVCLSPSHRDVQPCSHLVYRYTANRTVSSCLSVCLSVTATGCVLQRTATCSTGCQT
jgi:hypothetical protein